MDVSKDRLRIFEMALDFIGEFPIDGVSKDTKAAKLCIRNYEVAKKSVLRLNRWNSASKTALIPAPEGINGLYKYKMPDGCVRVCEFGSGECYSIEGRYIITSLSPPVSLNYIDSEVEESALDPLLEKAIAVYLAWTIAYSLTGSLGLSQSLYKLYKLILKDAFLVNAREGKSSFHSEKSFWLESRSS